MNEQTRKALELARQFLMAPSIFDRMEVLAAIDAALAAPAAPVAQPLTYEQIVDALVDDAGLNLSFRSYEDDMKFARAIERAHGIGQGASDA